MLVEQHGGQAALARASGKAPAYVSQLVLGIKNLGEASSRSFESALGLPMGWFDTPHVPTDKNTPFPIEVWEKLPPESRSLILNIVEFFRINRVPENEEESRLLQVFRACNSESRKVVLSVAAAQAATRVKPA